MTEDKRVWRDAGYVEREIDAWQSLAAREAEFRGERAPDALGWALAWRAGEMSFDDAVRWSAVPVPLLELPTCAALARHCFLERWYVQAWASLLGALSIRHIPLLALLQRSRWEVGAIDLLATAPRASTVDATDVLTRLAELPPRAVLDGARAGLDLVAAVELAEFAHAGGSVDALLSGLIGRRHLTPEMGARINVAISDIGDEIAPGAWSIVAPVDARVLASVRNSLPEDLWEAFLAGSPPDPGPLVVEDPTGGDVDAWTPGDAWDRIDPPEDRAVQPVMTWTDAHQMDTLRRYLADHLLSFGPRDSCALSWPPVGYLTDAGHWSTTLWVVECDTHGLDWIDECCECADARGASNEDPVRTPATWSWRVEVTTYRQDGESESTLTEWWQIAETTMDPRSVHFR